MRRTWTLLVVLGLCLLLAPTASAGVFEDMYVDYAKDGKLNACAYPESLLKKIKSAIPKDIEQYAPDFPAELDAAIARRAKGECAGGQQHKKAVVAPVIPPTSGKPPSPKVQRQIARTPGAERAPATTPPAPTPQAKPAAPIAAVPDAIPMAARKDGGGGDLPAPVIFLAALGLPLAIIGGLMLGARWWGWEPRWVEHLRHSMSEAGWRASSTWSEFTDFVRFGR